MGGGGVYSLSCTAQVLDHRHSHPYNPGTEHFGFSTTRYTKGVWVLGAWGVWKVLLGLGGAGGGLICCLPY